MGGVRYLAIDWSGAKTGAEKKIWLAEAQGGRLIRLECGRDREQVARHLIEMASESPELVAGFDFGFSAPAWFLRELGLGSAPDLWALACDECENWLGAGRPPFWGGGRGGRPSGIPASHRVSDLLLPRVGGVAIKSVFQVGGSGSVGTGSLRGWPVLHALRGAGFAVWPFDPVQLPLIVEIYPRLLTGPVNKSSRDRRRAYLDEKHPDIGPAFRELAAASDDAFDAAISALAMSRCLELKSLPVIRDADILLEGVIWHPSLDLVGLGIETGASP
jgi:hypothetical protein